MTLLQKFRLRDVGDPEVDQRQTTEKLTLRFEDIPGPLRDRVALELADRLLADGYAAEAVEVLRRAVTLSSQRHGFGSLWTNLGMILLDRNEIASALAAFSEGRDALIASATRVVESSNEGKSR